MHVIKEKNHRRKENEAPTCKSLGEDREKEKIKKKRAGSERREKRQDRASLYLPWFRFSFYLTSSRAVLASILRSSAARL